MCLWNPDIYLEDILCLILDQKKYIFYGLVELIKKWAEKRKENNCGFMLQADFHLFKAFLETRKLNVGLGFCVLMFKERFLIHKYIWCQFPEPLLTYH